MAIVCLDVFSLLEVQWGGESGDSLLVCVDRLSGSILARPRRILGLTAEKAAHLILDNRWENFGVPSVITNDHGPNLWTMVEDHVSQAGDSVCL